MVLSLSSILTAQQFSAPQSVAGKLSDMFSDKKISFKDHLTKAEKPEPVRREDNKVKEASPITASNADNSVSQKINYPDSDKNLASVNGLPQMQALQPDVKDEKNSIKDQSKALADLYDSIKKNAEDSTGLSEDDVNALKEAAQAQDNAVPAVSQQVVSLNDLQNYVKQLQDGGENLPDDTINTLDEILPKLAEKGIPAGISAEQVVSQVIDQIKNASGEGVDDILSKMNLANTNKKVSLSAEQLAQQAQALQQVAGVDIAKIASKVIAVAKDEAGKPQIPASNMRLLQVASLSKKRDENIIGSSEEGDSLDITGSQVTNTGKVIDTNKADSSKDTTEKLHGLLLDNQLSVVDQKKTDDALVFAKDVKSEVNVTNSTLANNSNNTATPEPKAAAVNAEAGKNLEIKPFNAENISITSNTGMSSENFVKFQNMLENAQAAGKTTTTSQFRNANEVLAQIKFGMSGMAKDEQNISIQLHPRELGKVDITMQIHNDGKTHVMVVAEKTDTLNLLQKEATSLREMLTDALKTDSGNLNFSFHEQGSDSWKQQFSEGKTSGINKLAVGRNIGAEYLSSQNYRYNMIATDGLDIRV